MFGFRPTLNAGIGGFNIRCVIYIDHHPHVVSFQTQAGSDKCALETAQSAGVVGETSCENVA
jgi:hypothetical protein